MSRTPDSLRLPAAAVPLGVVTWQCGVSAATIWLEAEWFRSARPYSHDGASGGTIVITNKGGEAATYEVDALATREPRVWVRIADGIRGGRRGVVRLNGQASPPLSGNATGLTWYLAGTAPGGRLRIGLTGIDQSPADCLYDAVVVTDDATLDNAGLTEQEAALRRAGWGGRGPRVALVHSDYSLGDYTPANAWDGALAALQCLVEKCPAGGVGDLMERLADYDVVLFTVMYRHGAQVFWNDLGAPLTPWVREGGLLIAAGGREEGDLGWLRNIHPALVMGLGACPTGMPGAISDELRKPNALTDGLDERPHDYGRLPSPVWPDFRWQHLETASGRALVSCPCGKPLLLRHGLGRGAVVAGTLFRGKGLGGRAFENLWAAHARRTGREYTPRAPRKTIAEQVAEYPGPVGEAEPKLTIDPQGTLLIDGAPFFPHGFYCVRHLDSLKILGDKGFNCAFGGGKEFLDEARKNGIRVVGSQSWDPKQIPDGIALCRRHPAFIGYGILEEPSNTGFTRLGMMLNAAVIKKCDPDKPRYVLPNNPAVFGTVAGLGEFILADPYCVRRPDSPLNMVGDHVRMLRDLHPGKPVWTLLQAHRFLHHHIIPSPAQLRAMSYLAIVEGARGILWFAFDDDGNTSISFLRYADGHFEQPAWNALCGLAKEMEDVVPWIVGPAAPQLITACGPERVIHAAAWERNADRLLIVVNSMPDGQTARLTLSGPVSLRAALFGSSTPVLKGTELEVRLPGYGVGLYVVRP